MNWCRWPPWLWHGWKRCDPMSDHSRIETAPKLVRRWRRRVDAARIELRLYSDGRMRLRVDDPSNDPGTEIELAGRIIRNIRVVCEAAGWGTPVLAGPLIWRDDPERAL